MTVRKLVGRTLHLMVDHKLRTVTRCVWCDMKSTPQMRNWSIVQNVPCGRTRNVQKEFPYLCVWIAKRMSLKNGSVIFKFPQVFMQHAASSRYVSQPTHRFWKIADVLNHISFMLFLFVIKFFKLLSTRLWIFVLTLKKPQCWRKM
jgi:hypothetical protein